MSTFRQNLAGLTRGNGLRAQLLRGGLGSIALKVGNIGLGLGMSVVLARSLGPDGYGIYTYVFALISLLAIPAQFGLPGLVVRETAKAQANGDWGLMRGLWRWAGVSAGILSLLLAVAGGWAAWLFTDHFTSVELITFVWGLAFIPLLALGSLRGAALRGLRKVVQGQLPEQILRPGLLILFVLAFGLLSQSEIRADQAMALNVLAVAIAFIVGAGLLKRGRPEEYICSDTVPKYRIRPWLTSALPFALISGVVFINTQIDVVMLGWFATAHDVGVYRVAARGATIVSLGFVGISMVVRPQYARFHALGEMSQFQRIATASARASLLLALPVAALFGLCGRPLLSFVFGTTYAGGYLSLSILAGAQLVRAGSGTPGMLLEMSGFEQASAKAMGFAALCNVVLNASLIPLMGMEGAALATSISLIVVNIALWQTARKRLGVDSSVFGTLGYKHNN